MNIWLAIYLGMQLLSVGIHLARHGELKIERYNLITSLIGFGINLLLLWLIGVFG